VGELVGSHRDVVVDDQQPVPVEGRGAQGDARPEAGVGSQVHEGDVATGQPFLEEPTGRQHVGVRSARPQVIDQGPQLGQVAAEGGDEGNRASGHPPGVLSSRR
jgi:hypothetical protein